MTYRLKPEAQATPSSKEHAAPQVHSKTPDAKPKPPGRLISLDAFRGFIMVMLAANGFGIYQLSRTDEASELWTLLDRSAFERFAFHFDHPTWETSFVSGSMNATEGNAWLKWKVVFWDLIQPAFMMMVGMAMPFSYARRTSSGTTPFQRTLHALFRALILVLLAVFLYSRGQSATTWIFTNVLAQIGLGYFFVYLLLGQKPKIQIAVVGLILIGTTLGMQYVPEVKEYVPEDVNANVDKGEVFAPPYRRWSKNGNAFHDFDTWFLNLFPRPATESDPDNRFLFERGGYTTLNFVPSMATMLLGVLVGQFVLVSPRNRKTLGVLLLAALLCTSLGVVAGATCCPVVKRIWTPSWVLFSGGYVIGLYALFYLLFDLLPLKRLAFPLIVVGVNSIFVYMVGQTLRPWIYREIVLKHLNPLVQALFEGIRSATGTIYTTDQLREFFEPVVMSTSVFLVIWLVCWWMYRQRIFFRI